LGSFSSGGKTKSEENVEKSFQSDITNKSNLEEKDPTIKNAVKNVTKITVTLDEEEIERYLVDELDIPPDPVKINDAIMKHASRQAFYGMLHNIAVRNHRELKTERSRVESAKEKHIKVKTPDITEGLYDEHNLKGWKKPNKDQIADAIDTYTDDILEGHEERLDELEEKIEDAKQLKEDLYVAYEAFKAQKDDLITLSSNYRHDSDLFKGLQKKKGGN
jgi:hypothetical protein